jgi:hypothetical protein
VLGGRQMRGLPSAPTALDAGNPGAVLYPLSAASANPGQDDAAADR